MFELARLVLQHFGSYSAFSSCTMSFTPACHAWTGRGIPTLAPKSTSCFRSIGIRRSRKTLVAYIVVLPNYQEDEATLRETPDNLVHSPSAGRYIDILLATDAFENRNTQDKGACLQRKKATYHPPGIPDQWAFRPLHTQGTFTSSTASSRPRTTCRTALCGGTVPVPSCAYRSPSGFLCCAGSRCSLFLEGLRTARGHVTPALRDVPGR